MSAPEPWRRGAWASDANPPPPAAAARIDSFRYHGESVAVLRDVQLSVRPGTLTAVLGGSGSGKTTLGKLLAGWLRAGHSGTLQGSLALGADVLTFLGRSADPRIDPAAWSGRVGYVPQDAAAILSTVRTTVAEELAFGLENRAVPRADMIRQVARTAERTGLGALLERNPAELSGGELRRLAVACAVICGPEVLILDDPLASLDAAGAGQLEELVRGLLDAGTAVVLLSQTADALARSARHWLVLDGGTATAAGAPAGLAGGAALRDAGVVTEAAPWALDRTHVPAPATTAAATTAAASAAAASAAAPLLELRGVSFGYGPTALLRDLDLTVRPGEIVAITGPNGTGKSTLLRHFNGLLRPQAGEVLVHGTSIEGIPTGRTAASVGLLFQQPRDQLFERTVLREVSFGLRRLPGAEAPEAAAGRARGALAAVGLAAAAHAHPAELPSSSQRLLALATVLARQPAVIALDEPTVGLDRHGLELLHEAVAAAAARGAAVVLVSHDREYARALAHRVLELDGGKLRNA
ncbi:ATP-binding cassette domain-containing protein [Arthrobacter sp. B3I4]|uniref:ATP-binding cassette domain-containing protein n=1 Tax=Arthrobacter sp. B3I4 TaxID=3042267 RepID=UPI0027837051|nr:ABC transporter ATP-binding protein [Arthrobacter sp. B3I4]MDQ0756716.1 energy-coupling factor transporter ATP-binding protein EcfA2 [Arthrobacter sp. B3I4]